MNVSTGIRKVFNRSRSWEETKKQYVLWYTTLLLAILTRLLMNKVKFQGAAQKPEIHQLEYLEDGKHDATQRSVIGKLSHLENIKAPLIQVIQLLQKSYKCFLAWGHLPYLAYRHFRVLRKTIGTLASESSCSVLIPNRGRALLVRLELCVSFFTPLIWHMGFSRSRNVGDGISTSFCLSEEHTQISAI